MEIAGTYKADDKRTEIVASRVSIQGENDPEVRLIHISGMNSADDSQTFPVQNKYQSAQFLRTVPHLRWRQTSYAMLLKLRSRVIKHFSIYFYGNGFTQVHTPIITSSDCEGAGEVFTVSASDSKTAPKENVGGSPAHEHFFKSPRYLTVSSQLHLEALVSSVERVWTLSPTFRAEKSDTARHLSEFYMLEAEMGFVDELGPIMNVVEDLLRDTANALFHRSDIRDDLLQRSDALAKYSGEARTDLVDRATLESRWEGLQRSSWPRVTYDAAIEVLKHAVESGERTFEHEPSWDEGFQAEHERFLAEKLGQGSPIFVTDYPRQQKPFYMSPTPGSNGRTVACFDLLVPDLCEIAGGSLREHQLDPLVEQMQEKGLLDPNLFKDDDGKSTDQKDTTVETSLDWYMDLRMYGSVPHGGFGLGFDRFLCYIAGVNNIRDMVAFPRWYGRCDT